MVNILIFLLIVFYFPIGILALIIKLVIDKHHRIC